MELVHPRVHLNAQSVKIKTAILNELKNHMCLRKYQNLHPIVSVIIKTGTMITAINKVNIHILQH